MVPTDPVVIVPVGALEEHGRHLPLGADMIQPLHVLGEVARRTGAHLAPAIPYGVCTTSRPYPGTVSVSVDALKAFVGDVLADFTRNGVRRIMIVSGHAGREHMMALRAAAQEVVDRGSGLRATVLSDYDIIYASKGLLPEGDGHAGAGETSRILTARHFLEGLSRLIGSGMEVKAVPTSFATAEAAKRLGIPLTSLEEHVRLDLCVDGADEVDPKLDLIKGLGGALFREKIVAAASRKFVVIVDDSKLVPRLGTKAPVPVEVHPFGWRHAAAAIGALGAKVEMRRQDGRDFRTDNDNHILDARFGPIRAPAKLAGELSAIPGVVGHGLFVRMASVVFVASGKGVRTLRATRTS